MQETDSEEDIAALFWGARYGSYLLVLVIAGYCWPEFYMDGVREALPDHAGLVSLNVCVGALLLLLLVAAIVLRGGPIARLFRLGQLRLFYGKALAEAQENVASPRLLAFMSKIAWLGLLVLLVALGLYFLGIVTAPFVT